MDIKYIFLSNSLPFEESGYSPQMSRKLVKLLPLGLVHSTKGDFLVDHESFRSIRNRFMERQLQILLIMNTRLYRMCRPQQQVGSRISC